MVRAHLQGGHGHALAQPRTGPGRVCAQLQGGQGHVRAQLQGGQGHVRAQFKDGAPPAWRLGSAGCSLRHAPTKQCSPQ